MVTKLEVLVSGPLQRKFVNLQSKGEKEGARYSEEAGKKKSNLMLAANNPWGVTHAPEEGELF